MPQAASACSDAGLLLLAGDWQRYSRQAGVPQSLSPVWEPPKKQGGPGLTLCAALETGPAAKQPEPPPRHSGHWALASLRHEPSLAGLSPGSGAGILPATAFPRGAIWAEEALQSLEAG